MFYDLWFITMWFKWPFLGIILNLVTWFTFISDTSYPGNYFRGRKPSDNVRNFVRNDDGESYRGTNNHDPGILWTGLGKKKRR